MNDTCGCCQGTQKLTPKRLANRPGLEALAYRLGTHAAFLETMKARLSNFYLDIPQETSDVADTPQTARLYPLRGLTTRAANDPSIALLDAWATVADVLTFYQERIANEGYLRTATERRSVLELARLVGYALRPGVASTVYLAYTVDENAKEPVTIPIGARAQSIPGPGELPQSFETSEDVVARTEWNNLQPRLSRPQKIVLDEVLQITRLYLAGTATNLKPNDALFFVFGDQQGQQILRRVEKITPLFSEGKTEVLLQEVPYLVIALVPLLRMVILDLEQCIVVPGNIGAFARSLRDGLLAALENLLLGSYPSPLDQFLSHDRIYSLLRGESSAIDWFVFLPKDALSQVANVMKERQLTPADLMADEDFSSLWTNLVDGIVQLLQNVWVRQNLVCSLRTIVEAARPKGYQDQVNIQNLIKSTKDLGARIKLMFMSVPNTKQPTTATSHAHMASYSAAARSETSVLRDELVGLLTDPHIKATLKLLLSDLGVIVEEIDNLGFSETKARLKEEIARANAAIDGLPDGPDVQCGVATGPTTSLAQLIEPLQRLPSLQPMNRLRLKRAIQQVYAGQSDINLQVLTHIQPHLRLNLYPALASANFEAEAPQLQGVYALRLTAPLFGYNAPAKLKVATTTVSGARVSRTEPDGDWPLSGENPFQLFLDNAYEAIVPDGYAIICKSSDAFLATRLGSVETMQRTAYAMSGKTTRLTTTRKWWDANDIATLRRTVVYTQSERLDLADEPITNDVRDNGVELDRLYDGLQPGRWAIVHGEVTHIPGVSGVKDGELVMIARVEQSYDEARFGDKLHTTIYFANDLSYTYKRSNVKIYGNVVKATHGETRNEVLGNGDGSKAFQSFVLKQPPLTYVAAPTPAGAESTLHVRVNDVEWHEVDSLASLGPSDRNFITRTDDEGKTTVVFGNGEEGARPPTGVENVKAVYRSGIGQAGNVKAEQVSLLVTRPLGVKEVINPLRASGGADKESRDQARKNAPLAVLALDRLVSTLDYADFACTFAGIGKASAARLSDGRRQLVYVTIAGANDIPIDETSDLYRNLAKALREHGDPYQPIKVEMRELMLIVLSANVRVHPDYQWESVAPKVRARLLDTFSFERRELGQDVLLSEVISAMQAVEGVAYVDVDMLRGIPEKTDDEDNPGQRRLLTPTEISDKIKEPLRDAAGEIITEPISRLAVSLADFQNGVIHPAQLAFLTPEVEATLILNEVKV